MWQNFLANYDRSDINMTVPNRDIFFPIIPALLKTRLEFEEVGNMIKNSKYSIQIDLNEFKLLLSLNKKTQLTFLFNSPSRKFYLSVIALVVNEMKKLGKIKSIPLQDHTTLYISKVDYQRNLHLFKLPVNWAMTLCNDIGK
jgi:hypothetical protein